MPATNTIYVAKRAASLPIVSSTAASVFLQSDNAALASIVYFPIILATNSVAFQVRAWGRVSTGTSGTFLATIQYGTSITAASNTDLAALGAQTFATTGNWYIESKLVWDSVSKKLNGFMTGVSGDTPTILAAAVNTAQITSVALTAAGLGLVVSGKFGTSNATNVCSLDGLTLEVL